ncbi:MAG TPA: alpha/beta hydrolase, partial [Flavisolibacter sp.]
IENGFPAFRHRTSTYAKDITCPVLLQWGRKDHLVKPSETLSVYRSLASRRKKLVVYEAGHTSFLRQSPGKWHEAMRKFLL